MTLTPFRYRLCHTLSWMMLVLFGSSIFAQVAPVFEPQEVLTITPVAPPAGASIAGTIFITAACDLGPTLLLPGEDVKVTDAKPKHLHLITPLKAGQQFCFTELYAAGGLPVSTMITVGPADAPPAIVEPVFTNKSVVSVKPAFKSDLPPGTTAHISLYADCGAGAALEDNTLPNTAGGGNLTLHLATAATKGLKLCAVETFTLAAGAPAGAKVPAPLKSATVTVVDPPDTTKSNFVTKVPVIAAVAGLDFSGASSVDYQPVFHATGVVNVPLSSDRNMTEPNWWVGLKVRIAGMAQPGALTSDIGTLAAATTYLATAVNATPDKIVQSFEVGAEAERKLIRFTPPSFDSMDVGTATNGADKNPTVITLSMIASGGELTPLSPSQANPPVYSATQQIISKYPTTFGVATGSAPSTSSCWYTGTASPTCYVSFVPQDRSHFYRHYEAGFRMKTFGRDFTDGQYRFPSIADITIGQNEYVTGGKLHQLVLHIGGWIPVPKIDGLYLFGSTDTTIGKGSLGDPLLLTPVDSSLKLTYNSPSVYSITVPQPQRDRYMFGFGIDLYHLLTKKKADTTP